jgi:hypothetical protein
MELMNMKDIIIRIINEIEKRENNLTIAGGRGYGAGKAYPNKTVSVLQLLGSEYKEKSSEYVHKPVEISKIFKKGKIKND